MLRTARFAAALLFMAGPSSATAAAAVRPPAVAGTFYPGRPERLRARVEQLLATAPEPDPGSRPVAAIAPHAGYTYSGATAAAAFRPFVGRDDIRRVVILGPSHYADFEGIALPAAERWATPLGECPVDLEFARRLEQRPGFRSPHPASAPEHSIEVQVPFVQVALPDAAIVPLLVGRLDRDGLRDAGETLASVIDDSTVLLASTDFVHYGPRYRYTPFADADPETIPARLTDYDDQAASAIERLDLAGFLDFVDRTDATICGRRAVAVFLAACRARTDRPTVTRIHRSTSADRAGDWSNCVTYQAFVVTRASDAVQASAATPPPPTPAPAPDAQAPPPHPGRLEVPMSSKQLPSEPRMLADPARKMLLELARNTVEQAARGDDPLPPPVPAGAPEIFSQPGKVFVTLKENGQLRGCIGSLEPVEPLWDSVAHNAVNAALRDPRFPPVRAAETGRLQIEISVMSPNRPIEGPEEFEVGRHGIILHKQGRTAVFLPQVAPEQGWGRDETLAHLGMKAGLPADAWRDGASFEVFTAEVFGEAEGDD